MGYVFISYSSKNQKQADELCRLLERKGIGYWIATQHITAGENYAQKIPSALRECACVILLLSEASQRSQYVTNEVDRAINAKKPLFPLRLDGCKLTDEFDFYLCRYQIVEAPEISQNATDLMRIVNAVKNLTGVLDGVHTPPQPVDVGGQTIVTNNGSGQTIVDANNPNPVGVQMPADDIDPTIAIILRAINTTGNQYVYSNEQDKGRTLVKYYFAPARAVAYPNLSLVELAVKKELGTQDITVQFKNVKGRNLLEVAVPRQDRQAVFYEETYDAKVLYQKGKLAFPVGMDENNTIHYIDISKTNNLFIGGVGSAGKTQLLHNIIVSLCSVHTENEVKLVLIDPKMVEYGIYNGIPHLHCPIITNAEQANSTMQAISKEVDRRMGLFRGSFKRDIDSYNLSARQRLPHIVIVIDEMANLIAYNNGKLANLIASVAQKGKVVGIHLVVASQSPGKALISAFIKANFNARIAMQTADYMESRALIDDKDASKLAGMGDLWYKVPDKYASCRVQAPFLSDKLIKKFISGKDE